MPLSDDGQRGDGTGRELWEAMEYALAHYVPDAYELERQFAQPIVNDPTPAEVSAPPVPQEKP